MNDAAARFLTLSSALSALSYLIFFVLLDKGRSSVIKNHILIFVINTYLIYLGVFMDLSGFHFMNQPNYIFRATMFLSSLLLCEAIFRRHAPKFFKLLTVFATLGLLVAVIWSSNSISIKKLINYYTIFHVLSLSLFVFVGLSKLDHVKAQVRARIIVMSKTFLVIAVLTFFHYIVMKHVTHLRVLGISGSIIIHSLLLSHRNKFNQFQFHPLFYGTVFSLISGAVLFYFVFREFNLNTYILVSTVILSLVLLFEQIEFIMIRRFKTINADFFDRLDDFTQAEENLSLKNRINQCFEGIISYYDEEDFPMIDNEGVKKYFRKNECQITKSQISTIKVTDKDLYNQLIELFSITNCDKLFLINSDKFSLLGFESDNMSAAENQKMDANILKYIIEGRQNEY